MIAGRLRLSALAAFLLGAGALAGAAAYVFGHYHDHESVSNLEDLQPLLEQRQFDEAERRITIYLWRDPHDFQANMLMAQVCLARTDQKPRVALEYLGRIRAATAGAQAMVLVNEGKAYSALGWNDRAEAAWREALRLDPRVPEAGWDLLGLYFVQGRRRDAHRLGMYLHSVEPDPRDRAQLLLELLRQDAQPIGPDSLVRTLEPLVRAHQNDLQIALAYGTALVRNSRAEDGLEVLHQAVMRLKTNRDAWLAWLTGLDEAGLPDQLVAAMAQLPAELAADPLFDACRGAVAQHRGDWSAAASAYERAWQADPGDFRLLYRLSRA